MRLDRRIISSQGKPAPVYVWGCYRINTTSKTTYTLNRSAGDSGLIVEQDEYDYYTASFNSSTGVISYTYNSASTPNTDLCYNTTPTSYYKITSVDYVDYTTRRINSDYYSVGQNTTTTRTQGNYIDDVTSENAGAYPQNGISGSYWYVYKGVQ